MSQSSMNFRAAMIVSALAGIAPAAAGMPGGDDPSSPTIGTTVAAPGQVRVANKFSAPFVTMAGSQENAVALANALRTGSPATLTYASLATDPADPTTTITTVTITPPTKPMGWGNVSHSLGLAQVALNQAGISNPTGAQLQAALQGGSVTTADGTTVAFAGVLQQRANGAGWGRIAQSYGTTMGAVNRGIKAPTINVVSTSTSPRTDVPTPRVPTVVPTNAAGGAVSGARGARGLTTAAGTTSRATGYGKSDGIVSASSGGQSNASAHGRGVVTAAGTTANTAQGAKGLTTAAGGTSSAAGQGKTAGIVNAGSGGHGNGNAYGRGVVTAAGGGASAASGVTASSAAGKGVVSGTGSVGHVVSANPGHGAGTGPGHGKGKVGG